MKDYTTFLLILVNIISGEILSEQVDLQRYQEGKNQYDLIKQRTELPAYGQCWLETLTSIHSGCKNVTDLVQSRLSLSYLNCFLGAQERHNYPCPLSEPLSSCTKNMTEGDRASLATFFVHTQNICYFLEIKYWNQHTQTTIQRLSDTSEDVVAQLEFSSRLQADMLTRQNVTLKNQELIIAQAVNLSHIISSSSSNIKDTLFEFRKMSQEQRNSINDVFERIAKLQSMFLGEVSSLYSIVFYSVSMFVWFLFTSVERTSRARLPLFALMSVNWLVEKTIIYYKTAEIEDPILGAHHDTELYELQWFCRKFHCLLGFVILVFAAWRYSDLHAENNSLLKKIHNYLSEARQTHELSTVNPLNADQERQEEKLENNSSTGYESDSSISSTSTFANESSDTTFTLAVSDSLSTISEQSSLISLQQELQELDEEIRQNGENLFNSPSTSRNNNNDNTIFTSTPLHRAPVHLIPRENHRYNLRARTVNNLNTSVKNESTKSFFYKMKGLKEKQKKQRSTSVNPIFNPDISDTD